MYSLVGMAAKLAAVAVETEIASHHALAAAATIVRAAARDAIGNPNNGYDWPPLAESTLARKDANTPLYETGKLRDSIEITMGFRRAWVGSNEDNAVWQEFGTDRIPPRSFIRLAGVESEDAIHEITTATVGRAFAGHKAGSVVMSVLRGIKEVADSASDIIDLAQQGRK